jgi:hypothetical protein
VTTRRPSERNPAAAFSASRFYRRRRRCASSPIGPTLKPSRAEGPLMQRPTADAERVVEILGSGFRWFSAADALVCTGSATASPVSRTGC